MISPEEDQEVQVVVVVKSFGKREKVVKDILSELNRSLTLTFGGRAEIFYQSLPAEQCGQEKTNGKKKGKKNGKEVRTNKKHVGNR